MTILLGITYFVLVCSFIIGVAKFSYMDPLLRRVFLIVLISAIVELGVWVSPLLWNKNYFMFFYNQIEFTTFAFFYYALLDNKAIRKSIILVTVLFILFAFFNTLYIQRPPYTPSYTVIFKSAFVVICGLTYIARLFLQKNIVNPINYPVFISNTGLLIYYSFSLVFFSIFSYLVKFPEKLMSLIHLSPVQYIMNIIMDICIIIAFLLVKKKLHLLQSI
ncbi:hypothetical protein GS399_02435 [Pedobacter sp. HMF7647]|uniref:Uncharacterized protein n=1 Tax=Hufsiella arboris TaxID=2695275 RepID=A0A7K1Y5F0_9SPHI|nr:hypothetical protein [Hufsiella arboris]MXV49812.1 hypothetical protein [Hufsiella arboris]